LSHPITWCCVFKCLLRILHCLFRRSFLSGMDSFFTEVILGPTRLFSSLSNLVPGMTSLIFRSQRGASVLLLSFYVWCQYGSSTTKISCWSGDTVNHQPIEFRNSLNGCQWWSSRVVSFQSLKFCSKIYILQCKFAEPAR
jgi:hypothetical protein